MHAQPMQKALSRQPWPGSRTKTSEGSGWVGGALAPLRQQMAPWAARSCACCMVGLQAAAARNFCMRSWHHEGNDHSSSSNSGHSSFSCHRVCLVLTLLRRSGWVSEAAEARNFAKLPSQPQAFTLPQPKAVQCEQRYARATPPAVALAFVAAALNHAGHRLPTAQVAGLVRGGWVGALCMPRNMTMRGFACNSDQSSFSCHRVCLVLTLLRRSGCVGEAAEARNFARLPSQPQAFTLPQPKPVQCEQRDARATPAAVALAFVAAALSHAGNRTQTSNSTGGWIGLWRGGEEGG
eukprot:s112_g24.t1